MWRDKHTSHMHVFHGRGLLTLLDISTPRVQKDHIVCWPTFVSYLFSCMIGEDHMHDRPGSHSTIALHKTPQLHEMRTEGFRSHFTLVLWNARSEIIADKQLQSLP